MNYSSIMKDLFLTLCCILIFLLIVGVLCIFAYEINPPRNGASGLMKPLLYKENDGVMEDVRELAAIVGRLRNEINTNSQEESKNNSI